MQPGLLQRLPASWTQRGPLAFMLWPLSLLYGAAAASHRLMYRLGLRRADRLPVPVVVVGNVVAGGGGKTPVVIALAQHLTARGVRVGVVSRGYGRVPTLAARTGAQTNTGENGRTTPDTNPDTPLEVTPSSVAAQVGDEPLLIAQRCGVPVFVARRRAAAARALLAAQPGTQVVLSDDGLQHHALHRDLTVCVFDARGVGNGFLLPAGPLRSRGGSATWVLQSDQLDGAARQAVEREVCAVQGRYPMARALARHAVRADGARRPLAALATAGSGWPPLTSLGGTQPLPASAESGRPLMAVAAIAQPEVFFSQLRAQGLVLAETLALPDHYDFDSLKRPSDRDYQLICTEKDAVKLWRRHPDAWAVPLLLALPDDFFEAFDHQLDALLKRKPA